MLLSNVDIREQMHTGNIAIDPFTPDQMNPNSYDLRLAGGFILGTMEGHERAYFGPVEIPIGQRVYIPNGGNNFGVHGRACSHKRRDCRPYQC